MKGSRYDAQDYAAELTDMARDGLATKDFIERSNPSLIWFRKHVRPIVKVALCHSCRKYYNPSKTGSMTECKLPRCPDSASLKLSKGNGGNVARKPRTQSRKLFAGQK